METIYHELLQESIPKNIGSLSVLLVGALPQTIAFIASQSPQKCTSLALSHASYTAAQTLSGVENIFGDCAFDPSIFSDQLYDLILFPITKSAHHNLKILATLQKHLSDCGVIQFVGLNNSGVKGLSSKLKKQGVPQVVVTNKRGGRVISITASITITAELYLPVETTYTFKNKELSVTTMPGLFSYKKSDKGTQLLLNHFPKCTGKKMLHIGCGSGVLSLAATEAGTATITAVDISATAVALAKQNTAAFPHINVVGGDMGWNQEGYYDIIVTNPPFHDGIKTDLTTGERWLDSLLPLLHKGGVVWLVANAFISYGIMGRARFSSVERIAEENGFIVYKMVK